MNVYPGTPILAHATNANFNSSLVESVAPSGMIRFSAIAKADHASAAGSLQLQFSNTKTNASGTYVWVNLGSALTITGVTAVALTAIETCYGRLRFVYTDSSSGVSTALLTVETMALTY